MNRFIMITFVLLLSALSCMDSVDNALSPLAENENIHSAVVNGRIFYYAHPVLPPAGGYPVVMIFHGGDGYAKDWLEFEGFLTNVCLMAINRGYMIIAPESGISDSPSGSFTDVKKRWDTSLNTKDVPYIMDIFTWLPGSGKIVNMNRIFAVGISSGGAIISRFCQTLPNMYNRVVIVSSVNPNYGIIPATQVVTPAHPSVLFIHGTADFLTPYARMLEYYNALTSLTAASGVTDGNSSRKYLITHSGGHFWYSEYHDEIFDWLDSAP